MRYAYDCAWAPFPHPADAAANGFEGMIRYLSHTPSKNWTSDEISEAHAAGLWVMPVWETTADRAGQGHAAGVQDCHDAEAQWAALGGPAGSLIWYAVDYDPTADQVIPYFEGVRATAHFKVGAYCSDGVATGLRVRHLIDHFWQTESTGFHGRWPSPDADIIQHVRYDRPKMAGDYDENIVRTNEFGQWRSAIGGFLMALTDKEQETIRDEVAAIRSELHQVFAPQHAGLVTAMTDLKKIVDAIATKVGATPE